MCIEVIDLTNLQQDIIFFEDFKINLQKICMKINHFCMYFYIIYVFVKH